MLSLVMLALVSKVDIRIEKQQDGVVTITMTGKTNAPYGKVVGTLQAVAEYPSWMPMVTEARQIGSNNICSSSSRSYRVYTILALPFPIGKCDQITETTETETEGCFQQEWSSRPDYLPTQPGVNRIKMSKGTWTIEKIEGGTKIGYEANVDRAPLPWFLIEPVIRANTQALWDGLIDHSML